MNTNEGEKLALARYQSLCGECLSSEWVHQMSNEGRPKPGRNMASEDE